MKPVHYFAVDREGIVEFDTRFADCAAFCMAECACLVSYCDGTFYICNVSAVETI